MSYRWRIFLNAETWSVSDLEEKLDKKSVLLFKIRKV
jgi:hypothetical protein